MDEIKTIPSIDFNGIVSLHTFQRSLLLKDYYLTRILYSLRDVEGIYFKGGTAINKILLNHPRLSEDIDFTLTKDEQEVKEEITKIVRALDFYKDHKEGKNVEGFVRIIVICKSELGDSELFIDLNKRAKLVAPTEVQPINHFYVPFIPEFSMKTLGKKEMIAEKVAATIGRNKPRDHFDVYNLIREGHSIDLDLVKKKCVASGCEFSILKMFNKAQTLKNRWDRDMIPLLAEPILFQEVIKSLSKHFKLKEEKENIKKNKRAASQ